jgi:hypothetical protein
VNRGARRVPRSAAGEYVAPSRAPRGLPRPPRAQLLLQSRSANKLSHRVLPNRGGYPPKHRPLRRRRPRSHSAHAHVHKCPHTSCTARRTLRYEDAASERVADLRAACILEKMLRKELVLAARALAAAPLRAECTFDVFTVGGAWGVRGRGLQHNCSENYKFLSKLYFSRARFLVAPPRRTPARHAGRRADVCTPHLRPGGLVATPLRALTVLPAHFSPLFFFFYHSARHSQPIPLLFFGGGDESLEDGSKYNPAVISFIRDEYIHSQMQQRCVARAGRTPPQPPHRASARCCAAGGLGPAAASTPPQDVPSHHYQRPSRKARPITRLVARAHTSLTPPPPPPHLLLPIPLSARPSTPSTAPCASLWARGT